MEDDSVDTGKVIKTDPTAGTTRKEDQALMSMFLLVVKVSLERLQG